MSMEKAVDVLAYAASCAREMYEDPSIYASHRLLFTMERFLAFVLEHEEYAQDPFFAATRQSILDNYGYVMSDPQKYQEYLDQLIAGIAEKSFGLA